MPQYEIAGLITNIETEAYQPFERMTEFLQMSHQEADINIIFKTNEYINFPKGNILSDTNSNLTWIEKNPKNDGYYLYATKEIGVKEILVLVDVDRDWLNVVVTCCPSDVSQEVQSSQSKSWFQSNTWLWLVNHTILGIVFRNSLLQFDGLVIHASTLKWNSKGLMFSAPSGTGKSTHVKLWQEFIDDVEVLNDDTPAIRIINNKPYVFGTPWSGSSFIHSNDSAPLEGIVLLEQAPKNAIRRLNHQEAILKLLPQSFLPYFDQDLMSKALKVFEKIVSTVPVYFLQCRPDKEAVDLVYQCVK